MEEQGGQPRPRWGPRTGGAASRAPAEDELTDQLAVLEAAAAIGEAASLDLDPLLAHVCRQAATSLACERVAVYLGAADLRLGYLHAPGDRLWRNDGRAVAEDLARRAPVHVEDTGALDGPWSDRYGAASVLAVALERDERALGLLVAARTARGAPFTAREQRVGAAIARQAATAIANAQRYEAEREAAVALEEQVQARADHVTGLVHDLRTPLTGMLGFVRTLRGPSAGATPTERAALLDVIARQGERLAGMVDDLLLAARSETGPLSPDTVAPVALAELLPVALENYDPELRARVRTRIEDTVTVRGDSRHLLRVVQNLLDNALRYSPADEPVVVRVGREGDMAVLEVSDRGDGIPVEQVPRLFHRFSPGRRRAGSTGFGLYVVREIVVGHGGSVSVTGHGEGAVFTVRLPV